MARLNFFFLNLLLLLVMWQPVLAVWPPSTVLEEETTPAPKNEKTTEALPIQQRLKIVTGKIEEDERALNKAISDLNKDKADLEKIIVEQGSASDKKQMNEKEMKK